MKPIDYLKEKTCICITPTFYKQQLLQQLSLEKSFYSIQFLTKEELQKQILYEYKPEALWRFCNQYNLIPENGQIILDALYAVSKDDDLYIKKEWLKKNHLIIEHPFFIKSLKQKKVWIYGYDSYEMKFLERIIKWYTEVEYIEEHACHIPEITEYETLEQEVVGVATKIASLLEKGISIDHIFISIPSNDYKSVCSKIFRYFHIPFQAKEEHSLYEYDMVSQFLKLLRSDMPLQEIESTLEKLEPKFPSTNPFFRLIYDAIFDILTPYYQEDRTYAEIEDIFLYELKQKKVPKISYQQVIKEVDFLNTSFDEEDYIFLLGANLGEFPHIYEDQDYFSDAKKEKLFLPTSLEMTLGEEQKLKRKISSLSHVLISYKKKTPLREYIKSPFLDSWKDCIQKGEYDYQNHDYNTYLLHTSLDTFINFNQKTKELNTLYGTEPIYYQTYNNQFTGIEEKNFQKAVPTCLLSYTSMQKFFECPFKYYVSSILKIQPPFIESPSLLLGNIFHAILERYFKNPENVDNIIKEELEQLSMEPIFKKQFYQEKYTKEIKRLIDIMHQHLTRTDFVPTYFEKTIEWVEQGPIQFTIFGKIDKIMTFQDENDCYAIVIDYKTGKSSSDLSKVIYGMNMQLLLYLYLLSKDSKFKTYQLVGAYLHSISPILPNYEKGKTLEEQFWNQSKLDGITLKRQDIISHLDHQYLASYIKGIRVKKDGTFYDSKQLLEPFTLEQLLEIVKQNIDIMKESIIHAKFLVQPKKFTSEFREIGSCKYCSYRDLCYLKPKDIVTLKEYKNLEFLGGEKDDSEKTNGFNMDR